MNFIKIYEMYVAIIITVIKFSAFITDLAYLNLVTFDKKFSN